jgi:hypothetical protein
LELFSLEKEEVALLPGGLFVFGSECSFENSFAFVQRNEVS